MSTLTSVIPIFSRPLSSSTPSLDKGKTPLKPQYGRDVLKDEPLPVRPSDTSPRNARIVGRAKDVNRVSYRLKVGDIEINNVGIGEILDYVSAQQLEDYENQQFHEEADMRRIAKAEEERKEIEGRQRKKENTKLKGITLREDTDAAEDSAANGTSGGEIATGRHGRARPTYKHLFNIMKERRRRKRDPATGELMPLSDEDDDHTATVASSEDDPPARTQSTGTYVALPEPPKRRRRKRDPVTGELMPLEPKDPPVEATKRKRRRRKRHPITGELMPLGWRYDPDAPQEGQSSGNAEVEIGTVRPALQGLSLSAQHNAKRVKLDDQSSSGTSSPLTVQENSSLITSGNRELGGTSDQSVKPTLISPPSTEKGRLDNASFLSRAPVSSKFEALQERNRPTSILQPVARAAAHQDQSGDDELEDEWVVETILAHKLSDPNTHPPGLGTRPVMLYQVKWEGWDEPTWEPIESFPDRRVVDDYYRTGASRTTATSETQSEDRNKLNDVAAPLSATPSTALPVQPGALMERRDDKRYDVEAVMEHKMSDPTAHGPDFGKEPIMLYKVKWKGYQGHTWEPISSFDDPHVVHQYRKRIGLAGREDDEEDGGDDTEMG